METGIPSISTTVYIDGTPIKTVLKWTLKGPILLTNHQPTKDSYIIMREKIIPVIGGESQQVPLERPEYVFLEPYLLAWKPYVKQSMRPDSMYPPSSENWVSRYISESVRGLYAVQRLKSNRGYWLTILDKQGNIHESHKIETWELPIIEMKNDGEIVAEIWKKSIKNNPVDLTPTLERLLRGPPPSRKQLNELIYGADVDNIEIRKDMCDTLEQIVPHEFPQETRRELMRFLAWILKKISIKNDPIDLFYNLGDMVWFRGLAIVHLYCLFAGKQFPPYVKILGEVAERTATQSLRLRDSTFRKKIELIILDEAERNAPDFRKYAFQYMKNIGRREKIEIVPPITKEKARTKKDLRMGRLILLSRGFSLKTTIYPQSIGLTGIVSLSPAFRWPHKHTVWSATLEGPIRNIQHIQYMLVPPSIVESVSRTIGKVLVTEWNAYRINKTVFDSRSGKWLSRRSRIETATTERKTLAQLRREFGGWGGRSIFGITEEEAKILDFTSSNFNIILSKFQTFKEMYGVPRERIENILNDLYKKNIFCAAYRCKLVRLLSVIFDIQGVPEHVYSLVWGLMKHTPSALGMTGNNGRRGVVFTRISADDARYYLTKFPQIISNDELRVRTARATSFRSYQNTVLRRLLRPDGSWDTDISQLLRQSHIYRQRFQKA